MKDEFLRSLWKSHGDEAPMSAEELDRIVRQGMRGGLYGWKVYVGTNLAALLAAIGFAIANVVGYWQNPPMLVAQLGTIAVAGVLVAVGGRLLREILRIERADEPLIQALERRLNFVRTKYELWLWAAALSTVLLAFTVTTLIDNQGGIYRINQPAVFYGTLGGMLLFLYATGKLASYPAIREMRAALADLEAGTTGRIEATPARRRIFFWLAFAATILLTATLVLGVLAALAP